MRWGGSAPSGFRWSRFACEGGRLGIRRAGFAEWLNAAFAGGHARSEGCLSERSGVLARRQLGQEVLRAARLEERAARFVRGREARQGRGRRVVEGLALQRLGVRGRLRTILGGSQLAGSSLGESRPACWSTVRLPACFVPSGAGHAAEKFGSEACCHECRLG